MCTAESGEEVVECHRIGQVVDGNGGSDLLTMFGVEQVVGADSEIEQVPGLHAIRVVVIVLLSRLRQGQQLGRHDTVAV